MLTTGLQPKLIDLHIINIYKIKVITLNKQKNTSLQNNKYISKRSASDNERRSDRMSSFSLHKIISVKGRALVTTMCTLADEN